MPESADADRIASRMYALEQSYLDLAEKRGWTGAYLNLEILYHALDSYFQDIARMKSYRFMGRCDRHKQAAFTMKWLMASRPIQLSESRVGQADLSLSSSLLLANETFAIHAGLGYMDIAVERLSVDYFRNLLYLIHFHPIAAEQLASEMYLLEDRFRSARS